MKKRSVKTIALLLGAVLTITAAGCGKKEEASTGAERNEKGFPKELSIFASAGGNARAAGAKDWNDVLGFQLLEEHTGTHVNWITEGMEANTFNLLIASGNLPDIMLGSWATVANGAKSYADDDIIYPLSDMMKENMPNLTALLEENPDMRKQFSDDEDEIYYIPYIRKDRELCVFFGPVIRKDWLDKLGLEIPTNTDELYEVLKAFRDKDPNGNGKKDEIPLGTISSFGLMKYMFSPFGTTDDFYLEDGKVKYGIMEDNFEEALKYVTKLFEEGLVDPDYLLDDRSKLDAKIFNDRIGFLNGYQPSKYQEKMDDGKRLLVGIPHLKGPNGEHKYFNSGYINQVTTATSVAVTTQCKDPEGALKWLDQLYGEPGLTFMNFGKEGVTFDWVDGYPKIKDELRFNKEGKTRAETFGMNLPASESAFPLLQDWRSYEQYIDSWGTDAIKTWANSGVDLSGNLPNLTFTAEESQVNTQVMSQVTTYVSEAINNIIIGNEKIEHFPEVQKKVKSLGIEKVIANYQAAYDRYKNK